MCVFYVWMQMQSKALRPETWPCAAKQVGGDTLAHGWAAVYKRMQMRRCALLKKGLKLSLNLGNKKSDGKHIQLGINRVAC